MKSINFDIGDILDVNNKSVTYKIQLKGIKRLISVTENVNDRELVFRDFKHSNDNYSYSYWQELTEESLYTLRVNNDFYIKLRYTLQNYNDVAQINSITVEYEETENSNIIYSKPKEESSVIINTPNFDIYQRGEIGASLQQKLSKAVNQFIGIDAIYYKSNVLETDMFLQEHVLLELADECGVQIKVMFEDNTMPEKPLITPFGTTFEVPITVHLDHVYFQEHFKDHVPSSGDIIFIPITKGIWEVNGSNIQRGIMNAPIYWNVTLTKYQPKANRFEDNLKHDSILDNLKNAGFQVMTADDAFGEANEKTSQKVVKPKETRVGKKQNLDVIINRKVVPVKQEFENNLIIVSHFHYNLESILNDVALKYNVSHETDGDISFSAWVQFKEPNEYTALVKVENQQIFSSKFAQTDGEYILKNKANNEVITVHLENSNIIETINNGLYYILDKNYSNIFNEWFILNNKYLINSNYQILDTMPLLEHGVWYNIIITESVRYNQVGVFIYKTQTKTETPLMVYSNKFNIEIENIIFENVQIKSGLSKITNIRLFDEMLQESDHVLIMNQQFVNDSQKALIIDNVKPEFIQEYYGRPL